MSGSALTLRSGEGFGAQPVAERHAGSFGSVSERSVLVLAGAESFDVSPWVVAARSSKLGHDTRIAATKTLDKLALWGHNKAMTTNSIRIDKTYRGKGPSRRTVWAVREYYMIGATEVRETLGTYATEAEAIAQAAK